MSDLIERLRAENEKLRGEYETKAAELAAIQIAFNDWKVMHSTVRLEVENERLRQLEQSVSIALPNVYYMDPPDGGDVQMDEQLRRMAKDAERYRHLRRKVAIVGAEFLVMNLPSPTFVAPIAAIEFDYAVDKEIGARTDARPPTPIGWSDTDFIKHLEDQARHPLEGLHINRGSVDAAADAYEAEYYDSLKRDAARYRFLSCKGVPPYSYRYSRWRLEYWNGEWWNPLMKEELDAAIDAAMRLTRPAEES